MIQRTPIDRRIPVSMSGITAGTTTRRSRARVSPPSDSPTVSQSSSMVAIPWAVFNTTGQSPAMNITNTADRVPTPKRMIATGNHASGEIIRMNWKRTVVARSAALK